MAYKKTINYPALISKGTHNSLSVITTETLTADKAEFVRTLLRQNHSESTKRVYQESLRYFWGWTEEALGKGEHYPVSVDTVLRYIADHLGQMDPDLDARLVAKGLKAVPGPHSYRTIELRLFVLGLAHNIRDVPSPVRDVLVKRLMKNARRTLGAMTKRKKALTIDLLELLLDTCEASLIGKRDRALLLVGFSTGGRRRSELANFEVTDLSKTQDGYILRLRFSKTDQTGEGMDVPLLGEAAEALDDWLKAAKINSGKLFRAILPGSRVSKSLSDKQISRIVKQRAELAGLDPAGYSAHSLRSGFITSAGRERIPLMDAMQLSGHKDVEICLSYYRTGDIVNNPAARLVELQRKSEAKRRKRKVAI